MTTTLFEHRFEAAHAPGAPVVLLLHGTGGDENDLLPLGRELAPGAALLSPRGQVIENGMPRFFRRLAMGVFDEQDLIARTHQLADFVASAALQYEFDPAAVWALGFSNGANIAAALMLLRPSTLAGAMLLRPMVPLVPAEQPDLSGKYALIASGRGDPTVPPDMPGQLADMLRAAGADVTLRWSIGGHNLTEDDLLAGRQWLAQRLSIS